MRERLIRIRHAVGLLSGVHGLVFGCSELFVVHIVICNCRFAICDFVRGDVPSISIANCKSQIGNSYLLLSHQTNTMMHARKKQPTKIRLPQPSLSSSPETVVVS